MATHCLHIGINDYRGTQNDLAGCVNDALDAERVFGRRRRGTHRDALDRCPFFGKADSTTRVVDRAATRARVLEELRSLLKKLERGDLGIFTFSGHGTYVEDRSGDELDGFDEALVCADLEVIIDDELATLIERRPVGSRLLVATDSCHSGTNLRSLGPRLVGLADAGERRRFLHPRKLAPHVARRPRRVKLATSGKLVDVVHFAACADAQYAADAEFGGRPGGAFTHEWLAALVELGRGATYGDWFAALAKRLPSDEFDQRPQVNAYARALRWKLPQW